MATTQVPADLSFILVPAGTSATIADLPFVGSLRGIYSLSQNAKGYVGYNPAAPLSALSTLLPGVYIANAATAFTADASIISQVFTPPVPPVVVPTPDPVLTGDTFSANSVTFGLDVDKFSLGVFNGSVLERSLQTPTTLRKAGATYLIKWDGKLTPTGAVLSQTEINKRTVKPLLSRVKSAPGWGVGNTSTNADNNMRSAFAPSTVLMETEDKIYALDPFNEIKPWFVWTYKTEQVWHEVLGSDWFVGTYNGPNNQDGFDIRVRYYEGGRHLRQDATYIYLALVHTGQDQKFSSGIVRIRKSDHAVVPFTNSTDMAFGNSAPFNQNVRRGLLAVRQNTTLTSSIDTYRDPNNNPYSDAEKLARKRALSAQTRITGLAVNTSYIMVARAGAGVIDVYQNNTAGTFVASITTVAAPGAIDFLSNGSLVAITNGTVKGYTFNGTSLIATSATYATTSPMYVSAAKGKDEFVVMQGGVTQQNAFFTANGTKLSKTWGTLGGKVVSTNVEVALTDFMHVCLSKLAYDAIDREAFGGEGGSITYSADDSGLWMTDWGHARALSVNSTDLAYRTQVAHIYDFLSLCLNPNDPTEVISNHLGFYASKGAITGGDHMRLPVEQRTQYLARNYMAGKNPLTWGFPRCSTTLKAGTTLANGTVLSDTYTYLLIPDGTIQREPGRPYCRIMERYNGVLRDTGITPVAYGNGGEDTTLDADGTLYRPVSLSSTTFQVAIGNLTSINASRNPVYAAETYTPVTTYGPLDPWPTHPYWGDSPTRIRKTKSGYLFIAQMLRRQNNLGSNHLGLLDPATGKFVSTFWKGTNTDGLTGRNEYPEANNAFNAGTTGANADAADDVTMAHYNAQRDGAGANSQFLWIKGQPAHEWQVSDGGGLGLSFPLSAAGNIMDAQLQKLDDDTYASWFNDESDGSKVHRRLFTGFAKTTTHTFNGADVFSTTANVYGRNIFNVNDPGVTAGVLIRPDSGQAQGGTAGFTGNVNYIDVSTSAGIYVSNIDLPNSQWYTAANEAAWMHLSFKDTNGVRPNGAKFLRVSLDSDATKLMILEGELLPEDGSIIAYVAPGGTATPMNTPAAPNLFNKAATGNVAGYYVDKNSGVLVQDANWNASYYIPVTPGLEYSGTPAITNSAWFTSTSPAGYISSYELSHIAPAGVAFLRVSINDTLNNLMVVQGPQSAVPTTYTAYGGAANYAASATRSYPAASSYTYETTPLVVRSSVAAFNTGASSYTITGKCFNLAGPEGWLADVYMPNGELIVFDRCVFASATNGDMAHITDNSRVKFTNCIFIGTGTQAPGVLRARAIFCEKPRLVTVEHCYFGNTAGCKVNNWSASITSDADTVTWRYNRYDNIMGGTGSDYCQALQLQHVIRPGIEIAYNQIVNTPGASRVEDNFNFGESGGTAASQLRLHHNYIRGAYPANPTDGGFTGTGFTTDAGGPGVAASLQPQYILAEYNYVVACMNACMNIAAGHHITYQNNTCVVSGVLADGTRLNGVNNAVSIFKGQPAYTDAQFDYNAIVNNTINVNKANGENPYYVNITAPDGSNRYPGPHSQALAEGNTLNTYQLNATYADEQATFVSWQNALAAQQIQVGVLS